jgi:hypothetical protein
MSPNSKKSASSSVSPYALLDQDDGSSGQAKSLRGRTLKRPQQFDPPSPQRNKKASLTPKPKAKAPALSSETPVSSNAEPSSRVEILLARVESALAASEERAKRAKERLENLEEFIRNVLFPRIIRTSPPADPPNESSTATSSTINPSESSPNPPLVYRVPGVNLDLSRVKNQELKEGNAGAV